VASARDSATHRNDGTNTCRRLNRRGDAALVVPGVDAGGAGRGASFVPGLGLGTGWVLSFVPRPPETSTSCDSDDECSNESRK